MGNWGDLYMYTYTYALLLYLCTEHMYTCIPHTGVKADHMYTCILHTGMKADHMYTCILHAGMKAGQYKANVGNWGDERSEALAKEQEQLLRSKEVRGEKRRRDVWFRVQGIGFSLGGLV